MQDDQSKKSKILLEKGKSRLYVVINEVSSNNRERWIIGLDTLNDEYQNKSRRTNCTMLNNLNTSLTNKI